MHTFIVVAAVFAGSAGGTATMIFLAAGRKLPNPLLPLLWATGGTLIFGLAYRELPEKEVLPLSLLALAWGFGALIPVAIATRKYLRPITTPAGPRHEPRAPARPIGKSD